MIEYVKRIIMEQIFSCEVLDGYKIDNKNIFCEEVFLQIPEEKYGGIVNDEENDYLIKLISNIYNRKLLANKIFNQVEESIRLKSVLVDRKDVYEMVISSIPVDRYEAILKNRMDVEFKKIIDFSVEKALKNESVDKKYDRVLYIFGQSNEETNMSESDVLSNKNKLLNYIEMLLEESKEKEKEYSENIKRNFELKGREYNDPIFRQQAIRRYISDKLAGYPLTFNDFEQEVDTLINKYFSNDMSYFNLINGVYDTAIYDIVLIDSKEFKNIREDVSNILKSREKYFNEIDEDVKNAAILMTTSALCSMVKMDENKDLKNKKLDEYIHEQLYFNNDSKNNYRKVAITTLDSVLESETKSFKELMNDLRAASAEVDWKGMIKLVSLLTLGAATSLVVPAFVGSVAFFRRFDTELKEYQNELQKENDFFNKKFEIEKDSRQGQGMNRR